MRKKAGRTQAWLSKQLQCSAAHVGNVENGRCPLQEVRVKAADDALGAGGRLVWLHRELYRPQQVDWLDKLHVLQREAEVLREYHNYLVPGVLQTQDYARTVVRSSAPWLSSGEVEARVNLRSERSKVILDRENPRYYVVLDETVLLRPVATGEIMKSQFENLIDVAQSGRVMIQLYSWEKLPQLGLGGPFSLITSAQAPDVLHAEVAYVGHTTDEPGPVRQYGMLFSELQAMARDPEDTVLLFKQKAKELS